MPCYHGVITLTVNPRELLLLNASENILRRVFQLPSLQLSVRSVLASRAPTPVAVVSHTQLMR